MATEEPRKSSYKRSTNNQHERRNSERGAESVLRNRKVNAVEIINQNSEAQQPGDAPSSSRNGMGNGTCCCLRRVVSMRLRDAALEEKVSDAVVPKAIEYPTSGGRADKPWPTVLE